MVAVLVPRTVTLLLELERAAELAQGGVQVTVVSQLPADYLSRLPLIHVTAPAGGRAIGPNLDVRVGSPFRLEAYAAAGPDAAELCAKALLVLSAAWRGHTATSVGVINRITDVTPPYELRLNDQPDSFARFACSGFLTIR